jgi:uncharacterized protein YcnI
MVARRGACKDLHLVRRSLASTSLAMLATFAASSSVDAHTDADLVAVPAGSQAVVTLKPTHGCAGSPTVEVRIRADVAGATAGEVVGWTATATDDGQGRTVITWTGGSLAADQEGAFPVQFTAPDSPGRLLLFPSVQLCENGEELAWIDGDPAGEFPAPRLLVLAASEEPAATIDDVPADAPGRDQLVAIVDVDNPAPSTTSMPPPATAPTSAPATAATAPAPTSTTTSVVAAEPTEPTTSVATSGVSATPTSAEADDPDDSRSTTPIVIAVVVALVGAAFAGVVLMRRRVS